MNLDDIVVSGWFHKSTITADKYHYFKINDMLSLCSMGHRTTKWKQGSYNKKQMNKFCMHCVEIYEKNPDLRLWKRPEDRPTSESLGHVTPPSFITPPKKFDLRSDKLFYHFTNCPVCGMNGVYPSGSPVPTMRIHWHAGCPGVVA